MRYAFFQIFAVALVVFFLCAKMFSDTRQMFLQQISQTVVPKNIYVGDKAEIRYSFVSDTFFFPDASENESTKKSIAIDLPKISCDIDTDEYYIENMHLEFNGSRYTLVVVSQFWVTGDVSIPPFDLAHALYGDDADFSCSVMLSPVSVLPLVSSGQQFRFAYAPLLVPGTVYFFYGFVVLIFLLLVALVIVVVRFTSIRNAYKNLIIQMRYKINFRKTLAQLNKLENDSLSIDSKDFCSQLENIARNYLSVRYGFSFASVVTSKIVPTLVDLTAGTLTEKKEEAAQSIVELFYRSDHVRFGEGSVGYVALASEERKLLIGKIKKAVTCFEDATNV